MMPVTLLNIALYAGCAIILTVHAVVVAGIVRAFLQEKALPRQAGGAASVPPVCVVIPARDEERNLPGLFDALDRQDTRDFTIVFINDRSRDRTAELLSAFQASHPGRVTVVTLTENLNTKNPKQYALGRGVRAADGEVLLLTDADCRFPPSWVGSMSGVFRNSKLGLAIGPVITESEGGYLHRYQAFDHLFRYFYTVGAAGLGMPSGGFGNNMAVRKAALLEAGGFESLPYSPTEDAALISAVRDRTAWKIAGLAGSKMLVTTAAENSWKSLSAQELRWNTGGIFAPDLMTRINYRLVMLYLTVGVLVLPLSILHLPLALTAASAGLSMLLVALAAGIFGRGAIPGYFRYLLPNVLVSMVYYTFITVLTLARRPIVWKGAVLDRSR